MDGDVGNDQVPLHTLLELERHEGVGVEKVFIVSRKTDNVRDMSEEPTRLLKRLNNFQKETPELVDRSYVRIPDFQQNFLMFSFGKMKGLYDLTSQWAQTHNPVLFNDYLTSNRYIAE